MPLAPRPPRQPQQWLPYLGLITLAGGIVYQSGVISNRVDGLTERIARIETTNAGTAAALSDINVRGARNEAKLDFLVSDKIKAERR